MGAKGESPATDDIARSRAGEVMETVAVVIPTLNEERSIGTVIDSVPVADLLKTDLQLPCT